MMKYTDRHCRYFMRLLTRRAMLYTEMITAAAVIEGDQGRLLAYHPFEHPLALQLGGADPAALQAAAAIAAEWGYDEVNLNIGCPSSRVRTGGFGARLMLEPQRAADCIAAMREAGLPVSAKCRTGVDGQESYELLENFVRCLSEAGCKIIIVHARKAWLNGLSPRKNRQIPPLRYDWVYRLQKDFPQLEIVLNGGIRCLADCTQHLQQVSGVMLGRAAYDNPALLADADSLLFGTASEALDRLAVLEEFLSYAEAWLAQGTRPWSAIRHILGLFHGTPGSRLWRRALCEQARHPGMSGTAIVQHALAAMQQQAPAC